MATDEVSGLRDIIKQDAIQDALAIAKCEEIKTLIQPVLRGSFIDSARLGELVDEIVTLLQPHVS